MKRTILSSIALCSLVAVFSCGGSGGNGTMSDSTGIKSDAPASTQPADTSMSGSSAATTVDERTHTFMNDAATAGNAEVALGNIAKEKTTNPRVKAFAEMMIKDHTAAGNDLKSIATKKNVTLPMDAGDHQKHIDELNKKTGPAFDKAYMDMMADGHKKVADEFEKASQDVTDPAVKNFATEKLSTIRMHLDSAKAIQKSLK